MTDSAIKARRPLFDRFVDRDPEMKREVRPVRTLDDRALRRSVRRELRALFNTRCPFAAHRLPVKERSVIDYGIPDFSHLSAGNPDDRAALARILRDAIEAFEPRLQNVRVTLDAVDGDAAAVVGIIDARLVSGSIHEPISFQTTLQLGEGIASVNELDIEEEIHATF